LSMTLRACGSFQLSKTSFEGWSPILNHFKGLR
jgi:hypothetical protein